MLPAISLRLDYSGFLIKQVSRSKNGLQPQLIRYDASVDAGAPTKTLTLSLIGTQRIFIFMLSTMIC